MGRRMRMMGRMRMVVPFRSSVVDCCVCDVVVEVKRTRTNIL